MKIFFILLSFLYTTTALGTASDAGPIKSKWDLWRGEKTHLRGANIWQTSDYSKIFSDNKSNIKVGPLYTQSDFDRMAAMGANYVNISHPGLFTESAPFEIDQDAQANLDDLLDKIAKADMFAVISFRTGPGRSEFTFAREEAGEWFKEEDLDETMWTDPAKQEAWVKMWRYTAERYKENPIVAGYELMVEPNSNAVLEESLEDYGDPEEFYSRYKDTLYDWNRLYPRIASAIRQVDSKTPILVGSMDYNGASWFPYIKKIAIPRIIYTIHQYEPYEQYTHQDWRSKNTYPGKYDVDYDDISDVFDKEWLDNLLSVGDQPGITVAVTEFGIIRWQPNAHIFMKDTFDLFEKRGWNHALWQWTPVFYGSGTDEFNFLRGPDPRNHRDLQTSDLLEVIRSNWKQNTLRPSNVTFSE